MRTVYFSNWDSGPGVKVELYYVFFKIIEVMIILCALYEHVQVFIKNRKHFLFQKLCEHFYSTVYYCLKQPGL